MNKNINHNLYINILVFLFSFAIFGLFWWIFKATTLFAADKLTYTLLANDIPGLADVTEPAEYLTGMVKVLIGFITALSVLVMVYAGVEHVAGAAKESSRSAAKEKMQGALLGLIIALISYIILSTINPDLLSLDLTISDIPAAGSGGSSWPAECGTFCTPAICPCPPIVGSPCTDFCTFNCPCIP